MMYGKSALALLLALAAESAVAGHRIRGKRSQTLRKLHHKDGHVGGGSNSTDDDDGGTESAGACNFAACMIRKEPKQGRVEMETQYFCTGQSMDGNKVWDRVDVGRCFSEVTCATMCGVDVECHQFYDENSNALDAGYCGAAPTESAVAPPSDSGEEDDVSGGGGLESTLTDEDKLCRIHQNGGKLKTVESENVNDPHEYQKGACSLFCDPANTAYNVSDVCGDNMECSEPAEDPEDDYDCVAAGTAAGTEDVSAPPGTGSGATTAPAPTEGAAGAGSSDSGTEGASTGGVESIEAYSEYCRIYRNKDESIKKFKTLTGKLNDFIHEGKVGDCKLYCVDKNDPDYICGNLECGEEPEDLNDPDGDMVGVCYAPGTETATAPASGGQDDQGGDSDEEDAALESVTAPTVVPGTETTAPAMHKLVGKKCKDVDNGGQPGTCMESCGVSWCEGGTCDPDPEVDDDGSTKYVCNPIETADAPPESVTAPTGVSGTETTAPEDDQGNNSGKKKPNGQEGRPKLRRF